MFQTEIIKFVQSFESPFLTYFFQLITTLGYDIFFFSVIISIMWGFNFKKGFLLAQILILTGFITEFFKYSFGMPRPYDVDSDIKLLPSMKKNNAPFIGMGGKSFFSFLPDEVLNYYKTNLPSSFGLPSGHTSSAVTLWGSLALLFRSRSVQIVCLVFMLLIPFSRIYLGKHFLGDILAGYILGGLILFIFYFFFFKPEKLNRFSESSLNFTTMNSAGIVKIIYLLGVPLMLLPMVPPHYIKLVGTFWGLNAAYLFIGFKGFPEYREGVINFFGRIVLAFITLWLVHTVVVWGFHIFVQSGSPYFAALINAVTALTGFVLIYYLSLRLRLIKKRIE